jgi:hypothetical protein
MHISAYGYGYADWTVFGYVIKISEPKWPPKPAVNQGVSFPEWTICHGGQLPKTGSQFETVRGSIWSGIYTFPPILRSLDVAAVIPADFNGL